jgi:hypothetical protein
VTCPSGVSPGRRKTESTPTSEVDWAIKSKRLAGFGAMDENRLKRQIALKDVQFECDAQWPFKGTYVRQNISHKTNQMEEQNPQSASALYVPLPHFT